MKHIHRIIRKKDDEPTRGVNFVLNKKKFILINDRIGFAKTEG